MAATSRFVMDSALDAVGNTPLIRLDRLAAHEGLKCNLLAKVEYTSIGGSVKDRVAKRMLERAEKEGRITPGHNVIIEPTSGNTGLGLAMACAVKGYKCVICMPQKMSMEKEIQLRALGAEVVRTPNDAKLFSPVGNVGVARRLAREIKGGIILDQYVNENNPLAHELSTGPEIIEAITSTPSTSEHPSSGKVDVFVGAAGTGGTVTGVARALKNTHNKDCHVIGVDPRGSNMALPTSLNRPEDSKATYAIEGIGYAYVPEILTRDMSEINEWVKITDPPSFGCVKLLNRLEGLLVGGSSGAALHGALHWLRETDMGKKVAETRGANVVVLCADGVRNYIGKDWFLDMAMHSEPSSLAKEIAAIREQPASPEELEACAADQLAAEESYSKQLKPNWGRASANLVKGDVNGHVKGHANGHVNGAVNGINGHVNGANGHDNGNHM